MLKRIICIITAISALLNIPLVSAAENNVEEAATVQKNVNEVLKDFDSLWSVDFENMDSSAKPDDFFDEVVGSGGIFREDDNGTYASSTGSAWLMKMFDQPLENGQYLLNFDLSRSAKQGLVYLRFFLSESKERVASNLANSFMMDGSKIGYYTSTGGWGTKGVSYEANEWNRVNVWIDTKAGSATYVVNNQVVGSSGIQKTLYGLSFVVSVDEVTLNDYDNISLYKVTPDLAKTVKESGIYAPEDLTYTVETEITSKYSGNIFTSFEDADIVVNTTNKIAEPIEYEATYTVTNFRGDEVWRSEPKKVKLGANEKLSETVHPVVDKYDVYTINADFVPTDKKYSAMHTDAEFSIVNAPTPGYKNYNLGMCIHISKGSTQWDRIKYAVDVMGIGWLRDDFGWGGIESVKGVYGVNQRMDTFFTEASEMGIKLNMNVYAYNSLYNLPWSGYPTAMTEEAAAAAEKAFEWFGTYTRGRITSYEAGNELNFQRIGEEKVGDEDFFFKKQAETQKIVYNGIKKGNPDAIIATNGFSRTPSDWVQKFIDAGAKGYFDVVAIHPYQGQSTPESTMWPKMVQPMRDVLDKNGLEDVQVWTTEGNCSADYTYFSPKQHGLNAVRQFAMVDAYNTQDVYFQYQIQTDEKAPGDPESWFGVVHGQNVKNAYGAKPELLIVANYIAQTEKAEFVNDNNDVDELGDGTYALRFKKPDGSYVAMMYANNDMAKATFDLGANSATVSDAYGNEELVSSTDGKYTFVLGDEPIYVSYSGEKFDRCEDTYSVGEVLNEAYEGDACTYEFAASDSAEINVDLPDNLTYTVDKKDGKATLKITVNENPVPKDIKPRDYEETANRMGVEYTALYQNYGTVAYRDYVRVSVKDGEREAYYPFGLEYLWHSADIEATLIPYSDSNTKHWKMKCKVTNVRSDSKLTGTIKATEPALFAEKAKEVKVELAPGETGIYYMNIPSSITNWGYHKYSGILTTEDGEEIKFAVGTPPRSYGYGGMVGSANLKPLKHTKEETKIDGIIDEAEWKDYLLYNFDKSQVSYGSQGSIIDGVVEGASFGADADYGGKADFSGSIYAKWDENYFYTAAVVYDDVHWQKQDFIRYYYEDEFYLNVVPSLNQRHDTKFEFALSELNDNQPKMYRNYTAVKGIPAFGIIEPSEDGSMLEIIRKDNVTIYEARVEWKEIAEEKTIEDRNINIRFGIRDYDGDRDKTYGDGGWWSLVK